MADQDRVELLGSVPLFSALSKRQLKGIASSALERTFKPGETIVTQGEKGIGFYLLLSGQAEVVRGGQKVGALSTGQFFGEMALVDEQPRTADVKATSDVRCLVLNRWEFWGAVGQDPEIIRALFVETVRRLRTATAPGSALTE